ncbi:MAG: RDD family protein [Armatimonadetes bacterium]|nr:RDD family protein [Akkermansiaceae bacterium]
MDSWYFNDSGQQRGPVNAEEIKMLLATHKIQADTLVWSVGMPEWKPASDVIGFQILTYAPPIPDQETHVDCSGYVPSGPQERPWVRYWARTLDFFLFGFFSGVAVAFWPQLGEINDTLFGIVLLLLYNFVEPVMLAVTGTTPFKALLRIRVRNDDGTKLSYPQGLRRTLSVWIRGMGLGIPFISLFTAVTSYKRLIRDGITSWDQDGGYTVTHQSIAWWRWLILFALSAGFIGLIVLGSEA